MRVFATAPLSLRRIGLVLAAMIALGLSVGIGLRVSGALAASPVTTINACVSPLSGMVRIVPNVSRCRRGETPLTWASGFDSSALEARLATLEGQVGALQAENTALKAQVPACLSTVNGDAVFSGCNVQIVNGSNYTSTTNGKGNLIVGYNEVSDQARTGSHNLVVGPYHAYTSYGGLVAGYHNEISGPNASVTGGIYNTASGSGSSVSGGQANVASEYVSSVSGGAQNVASGDSSSIAGGRSGVASEKFSSVSGGLGNHATGEYASVSGGRDNTASGDSSSVSGGYVNTASGKSSSVSGGSSRSASGDYDWAAGSLLENN